MSAIVLSEIGISIQSFQELRADLRTEWINAFGSSSLDLSPTTPDGHHLDLECKTITSISQIIEAVVNNLDRSTASGFWLDILAKFQNLTRKSATYSTVTVIFTGTAGTVIDAGTEISYSGISAYYATDADATIGTDGTVSVPCTCVSAGAVEAPEGTWSLVSSSLSGVTVYAEEAGSVGSDKESDSELRSRMDDYSGQGLATYDTMLAYMESIEGVSAVTLLVNDEDVTDSSGLPPHSFCFNISGTATDAVIAAAIWHCKPTGIRSYGAESYDIKDSAGYTHTVHWVKPEPVKLWLSVTISEYDEETLPEDYSVAIKTALVNYADSEFVPGKDVIPKRFYGSVYSVDGVLDVDVKCGTGDTEPPYSASVIEMSSAQYAVLTAERITVTLGA